VRTAKDVIPAIELSPEPPRAGLREKWFALISLVLVTVSAVVLLAR